MNNEVGNAADPDVTYFLQRLEKVDYPDITIAREFIVWMTSNIDCTVKNKNFNKDAAVEFTLKGIPQFCLYYQIVMNKLFFVVTQKDKRIKDMIDETLVPLFEPKYRKKFIGNNARKKDQVFWIDVEQFNDSRVFKEMTQIITKGFGGSSAVLVSQQTETKEDSALLPSKEDFESAYRTLTRLDNELSLDAVLDQINIDTTKKGITLKKDWRTITEVHILEIWAITKQ